MTQQFILTEELNPLENVLKAVIFFVNRIYSFINKVTGLVGIVVLTPLLAIITMVMWLILKFSNSKLEKLIHEMFRGLENIKETRALRVAHHAIRIRRMEADEMLKKSKKTEKFFLIAPLVAQIKYSRNLFFVAEERLHKTAYPNLYQPLSKEQIAELEKLSKNFEGIWEDNDYCPTK